MNIEIARTLLPDAKHLSLRSNFDAWRTIP
jgi:hypothetical protein